MQAPIVGMMTAESGPLGTWKESMALETRQFMALNAMNEALYIARQFAMDYFICPAMGYEPMSKIAKTAAISIFIPLFKLVDIQMERKENKMPAHIIGEVDIPDVPLFRENTQLAGLQETITGWLKTIYERKQILWTEIYTKRRDNAQDTWRSAMRVMAGRIDTVVTMVIVMLHKNIRGFPETEWMRRYAAFGGGTRTGDIEITGGEFAVENMEDHYKLVNGKAPGVEDRDRDGNIRTYRTITGPIKTQLATQSHKTKVKLYGAELACTDGWINEETFVGMFFGGNNNKRPKYIRFRDETKWRYGAFPFKSQLFEANKARIVGWIEARDSDTGTNSNISLLIQTLSNQYWNGYILRPGKKWGTVRLPNRRAYWDGAEFKEGAFTASDLIVTGEAEPRKIWRPRTIKEMLAVEEKDRDRLFLPTGEALPDLLERRLMQPGGAPGAWPEVMVARGKVDPEETAKLVGTPEKVGDMGVLPVYRVPLFGRGRSVSFSRQVVVIQAAAAPPAGGGESMGIGPFTYTGKNSWVLMSLLIMLLLFFLFR